MALTTLSAMGTTDNKSLPTQEGPSVAVPATVQRALQESQKRQKTLERYVIFGTIGFIAIVGIVAWFTVGQSVAREAFSNCEYGEGKSSRDCDDRRVEKESDWRSVSKGAAGGGDAVSFSLGN